MKKIYLSFGLFFISLFLQAQIVNIPDANFKNALINTNCVDTNGDGIFDSNADINNDGEIQLIEAESVLRLKVFEQNITSLEGLQYFKYLELLNCRGNIIDSLDLSSNPNLLSLDAEVNRLISLNITQNQSLRKLEVSLNQLSTLDISNNQNLYYLSCQLNSLTSLDLTHNIALGILFCNDNNLTSIDISQNINLKTLVCTKNPIGNLDLSNNPMLIDLTCQFNGLTTLDLSQNPNLKYLVCRFNNLSELQLDFNPYLEILQIDTNQFTSIDLSQLSLLDTFTCSNNKLRNLDLSQNPNLTWFIGDNNQLRNFNLQNGNNESLNWMKVQGNTGLQCIQVDDEGYANNKTCNVDYWCKDSTASYSEFCELIGVEDISNIDFQLFPNPAHNILNIQSKTPIEKVKIYTTQGILVKEISTNTFDVSQLSAGVYFVEVKVDDKSATKKFIKI